MRLTVLLLATTLLAEEKKEVAPPVLDTDTQMAVLATQTILNSARERYNAEINKLEPLKGEIYKASGAADDAVQAALKKCNAGGGQFTITLTPSGKVICAKADTAKPAPAIPPTRTPVEEKK